MSKLSRHDLAWLPDLVLLEDCKGSWENYNALIYKIFIEDFIENRQKFRDLPVSINSELDKGKEKSFWHITSEKGELERCKRIKWPKAILDNNSEPVLKIWENERPQGQYNILIWLAFNNNDEYDYIVILGKRKGYFHFITAYTIEFKRRKEQFQKEYLQYMQKKTAGS